MNRTLQTYSDLEKQIIELKKNIILSEMKILELTKQSVIHENQQQIAADVISAFKRREIINVMVVSQTQSGKTGSMCATIRAYLNDLDNIIPIENIYIITALSSCEWKEQTRARLPESLQTRIFHRSELPNTFAEEIKYKTNLLIVMDEIQVAAKPGQSIFNAFENAGLLNIESLYKNDVKILEYTATPGGAIYDLMKWNEAAAKIVGTAGNGYVSSYDLLQSGRIKQYKELNGYSYTNKCPTQRALENIKEIQNDIILQYKHPRYHIIRTKIGLEQENTMNNFKEVFGIDAYNYVKFDQDQTSKDINSILKIVPEKHTFIFIKEMLRCAKTICKENIGILYERYSQNPNDDTIIQGLVGRDTGYDNNGVSITYTNIDSIKRYNILWNSQFEDRTIPWRAKSVKIKKGNLEGNKTINNIKNFDPNNYKDVQIKTVRTIEEAKEYYNLTLKSKLGGRGPNTKSADTQGFYKGNIRGIEKIFSTREAVLMKRYGLTETNYRILPCYENTDDPNTLWWYIYHY